MAKARQIAAIMDENDDQHPDEAEAEIDFMVNPVIHSVFQISVARTDSPHT